MLAPSISLFFGRDIPPPKKIIIHPVSKGAIMLWIVAVLAVSFVLLMSLSLCRAAAMGDRQLEHLDAVNHRTGPHAGR
ncbi:MAG: hypothetical protein LKF49_08085 [Bifidobacterium tibiigranuli]|jgi:hypothetical protein|uniref:hypothetical protein n=1 Tax=Bifidobacterium tibiigranuli TaxID=2172043 RepID=UPI0023535816|nr:hypothetical protein [Bifidobacterium tibiigranuli]MCH3975490.1 hypothetical protein [Bifidobacterium tibiigranuli]MCH4204151.1 hypothetical protein [Bifidobacterium tibiigranuli]MCH4274652.1 hypothetical protein [Bifidobacterium tibiigranuli]MCI1672960.1 hypothetical protein [Bifidobacterium tibiigranuli]MCI1714100.1 hypothetical protein [Bifidobacterium tibiigranuli]